jgi:hypothetical protein
VAISNLLNGGDPMPINKDKNLAHNVVFKLAVAAEIQKLAEENNRSFSAQVAYMCEQYLKIKSQ